MLDRLKTATAEGVLLGVKYGVAAALILVVVSWLLGDYGVVRQRAANGQAAYEYLNQQATARAQQQK